ncbi:MAG TPA: type I 3-dehydroquinate dehydratase [Methanoregulaceae archaeon]|nr:type I 3-dehydroquinate dehydratase [Methanoregulaceae archaeon]
MKIAASVSDLSSIEQALLYGADLIEIRLDRMSETSDDALRHSLSRINLPVLLTLRSDKEGGEFSGDASGWWDRIEPLIPVADMVDVEQSFMVHAPRIREMEKTVIASFHTLSMPGTGELQDIRNTLAGFGDIPKIVPRPMDYDDVLTLAAFTHHSPKPVITSIMGEKFRFARIMLALFGSSVLFSYVGSPASAGQFHLKEAIDLLRSLKDSP